MPRGAPTAEARGRTAGQVEEKRFRDVPFASSHLRTFKVRSTAPSHRPFAQPRLLEEKCRPRRHFSGEPPRPIPERRTGARRAVAQPPTGARRRHFCSARCPRASSATRATSGGARRAPAPAPAAGASSTARAQTSQSCSRSWSAPGTASAASRTSCTCTTSRRRSTTSRSICKRSPRPAAPRRARKARSCRVRRGRPTARRNARAQQWDVDTIVRGRPRLTRLPGARIDGAAPAVTILAPPPGARWAPLGARARSWCGLSLQPSPPPRGGALRRPARDRPDPADPLRRAARRRQVQPRGLGRSRGGERGGRVGGLGRLAPRGGLGSAPPRPEPRARRPARGARHAAPRRLRWSFFSTG